MRTKFHNDLLTLDEKIALMSFTAEQALDTALAALFNLDAVKADSVIAGDDVVDQMTRELETDCVNLLAMQQPVASDLRLIYTVLKISVDLERIADHAVNIAEIALRLKDTGVLAQCGQLSLMACQATEMVHISMKAFKQRNWELAKANCLRDNQVDELNRKIRQDLNKLLQENQNSDLIPNFLDLLLVAENIERVADHATNISGRVSYLVLGEEAGY